MPGAVFVQIVLYSFRRCPYAMRARMALKLSQTQYEHREIELKAKPLHLLSLSPKGTVPVLWLKDADQECVIDQSLEIMKWSLGRHDPEHCLIQDPHQSSAMFDLIEQNDQGFKFNLDRYKYPHRFGLTDPLPFRLRGALFLEALNAQLMSSAFLFGPTRSLADLALMPFVRQFAHVDPTWFDQLPLEPLKAWLMGMENSELFVSIMTKRPLWSEDA